MSGTSLDGVDLACCRLRKQGDVWSYALEATQTVKYSSAWVKKLEDARMLSGEALLTLDYEYGKYLGVLVQAFVTKYSLRAVHFVASHGHTIFHQPKKGLTFQLGNGQALYEACGIPVVNDFRTLDVARGGEGAPLVPVGDKLLFGGYGVCLNLGGIANLSLDVKSKRVAFDVCFANMGLNYLAQKANQIFDKQGAMAAKGEIQKDLLMALKKAYNKFRNKRPSLGYELFVASIVPLLDDESITLEDRLATMVESIAIEIKAALPAKLKNPTMLCTGGGAFNAFLMYRLMEQLGDDITLIIPEDDTVKFKEALVFALLGTLRVRNETNCLKSVTGARVDSCTGMTIGFSQSKFLQTI